MSQFRGKRFAIEFDEKTCIHSGQCVARLPRVFDLGRTPWIDPDEGDEDAVRAVVNACPSGALSMTPSKEDEF